VEFSAAGEVIVLCQWLGRLPNYVDASRPKGVALATSLFLGPMMSAELTLAEGEFHAHDDARHLSS